MDYELKALEHVVEILLKRLTIKREPLSEEVFREYTFHAETERVRICNKFRIISFGEQNQKMLESYYQKHQTVLVQLADRIYQYLDPEGSNINQRLTNDERVLDFYKEVMQVPLDLLDFIEKHFPEYFNYDCKLP